MIILNNVSTKLRRDNVCYNVTCINVLPSFIEVEAYLNVDYKDKRCQQFRVICRLNENPSVCLLVSVNGKEVYEPIESQITNLKDRYFIQYNLIGYTMELWEESKKYFALYKMSDIDKIDEISLIELSKTVQKMAKKAMDDYKEDLFKHSIEELIRDHHKDECQLMLLHQIHDELLIHQCDAEEVIALSYFFKEREEFEGRCLQILTLCSHLTFSYGTLRVAIHRYLKEIFVPQLKERENM